MKKVLLAITLLSLLIAISYTQITRQNKKSEQAYLKGKRENIRAATEAQELADSLRYHIGQQEVTYADSLVALEMTRQSEVDSLSHTIDSLADILAASKQSTKQGSRILTHEEAALHDKVLSYYENRYKALPGDLSEYEKRVALNEIRDETARHFNITVAELNNIRKSNEINY